MPQTIEHAAVLEALGRDDGGRRGHQGRPRRPGRPPRRLPRSCCRAPRSSPARRAPARASKTCAPRSIAPSRGCRAAHDDAGAPLLHVDRAFTIRGAGTVVTGTLWSGSVAARRPARAAAGRHGGARARRSQVHDEPVDARRRRPARGAEPRRRRGARRRARRRARRAGNRSRRRASSTAPSAPRGRRARDARARPPRHARGARAARRPRRRAAGRRAWSARCSRGPATASSCARSRRPTRSAAASSSTPRARRHGRRADVVARLERLRRGEPEPEPAVEPEPEPERTPEPAPLPASALALEERLRAAGHEPPHAADLDAADLDALRAAGRAVRVGRSMYAHPDGAGAGPRARRGDHRHRRLDHARRPARRAGTSRKFAQALLEHLDAERVTERMPDDSRVLRGAPTGGSPAPGGA